jgi:type IV secretion system protein VirB10
MSEPNVEPAATVEPQAPHSERDIAAELRLRPDPPRVMRLSRKAMVVIATVGGLGLGAGSEQIENLAGHRGAFQVDQREGQ